MSEKHPESPKLTTTEAAALLGAGFSTCPRCQSCVVMQIYAFEGGPKNGPHWQPVSAALNPVMGTTHVCQGE